MPSCKLYEGSHPIIAKTTRKSPADRGAALFRPNNPSSSSSFQPPYNDSDVDNSGNALDPSVSTQTNLSFIVKPIFLESPVNYDFAIDHEYSQANQDDAGVIDLINLTKKVEELSFKVAELDNELGIAKKALFSVEKLQEDNSAVKFYTGFSSYSSLVAASEYFEPKVKHMTYWRGTKSHCMSKGQKDPKQAIKSGPKRRLSHFQEFIFVLIHLKVGLFLTDLADRFGISVGHASKIFNTSINFLFHELPLLFPYPSKDLVERLLPVEFKSYPSTRIILDFTEIFIEVPSSMTAQSQTWSEYKHHNTWRAFIGISPNGAITFVSKLWSGRVSDKEITQLSGVLSLLEPGDNVMADRGFIIADILPQGVTLNIPPFKGSPEQLTPEEAEETAKIASVRIHVERAIGRVKNYHILDGVLPLSLAPVANQIFTVCSLLTNFLPYLVNPSVNTK